MYETNISVAIKYFVVDLKRKLKSEQNMMEKASNFTEIKLINFVYYF